MDHKKKFLGGLKLFFLLLFTMLFVNSFGVCKAYTTIGGTIHGKPQFDSGDILSILQEIHMTSNYAGNEQILANTLNNWIRNYSGDIIIDNFVFYRCFGGSYGACFAWILGNGTYSNELPYISINSNKTTKYRLNITGFYTCPNYFNSYTYNASGDITGLTNSNNLTMYYIPSSNLTTVLYKNWDNSTDNVIYVSRNNGEGGSGQDSVTSTTLSLYNMIATTPTHVVYSDVSNYACQTYFLGNYVTLQDDNVYPTPTPTPTPTLTSEPSGDSPGGGSSLDDINTSVQQVNTSVQQVNTSVQQVNTSVQNLTDSISGEFAQLENTLTDVPSGDQLGSISSGDIESSLGFELASDPYANFWYDFSVGLGNALTSSVRTLPFVLPFATGVIDLDEIGVHYPEPIETLLSTLSTFFVFWIMAKWTKVVIDKVTSGSMDEVLEMNEEEGYTDLF